MNGDRCRSDHRSPSTAYRSLCPASQSPKRVRPKKTTSHDLDARLGGKTSSSPVGVEIQVDRRKRSRIAFALENRGTRRWAMRLEIVEATVYGEQSHTGRRVGGKEDQVMKHRTETQHRNAHRHAQRLSNTPDHVRSRSITRGHGYPDTRSHSFRPIHNQFRPDHSPTETEHRETERENMRDLPARS